MTTIRTSRRRGLWAVAGMTAVAAAVVAGIAGLQQTGRAQGGPQINLDAPVSFPVDI